LYDVHVYRGWQLSCELSMVLLHTVCVSAQFAKCDGRFGWR